MKEIELYGDGIGKVSYVQHVGNDKMIANAARVSFGNDNTKPFTKRDEKLVKYLIEHKHTSPFEHNSITFLFEVPMFVRSQHMRHRTWAYNEISRRYTEVDMNFYLPKEFRTQHKSNRQNLYAKYYGTVNLGNLLKFVDLRIHEGAQWEIQKVAEACLDIATEIWPFSVGAYREIRGA